MKKNVCLILITLLIVTLATVFVACGDEPIQFTVTFDSMGGSEVASIVIEEGASIQIPTAPTKEGYVFAGWYIDKDFANQFDFDTAIVNGNITLYAKWTEEYVPPVECTIHFNTNGGSTIYDIVLQEGSMLTLPAEPTKLGYEFVSWYVDENFAEEFKIGEISSDITLYAKWELIAYNIVYHNTKGVSHDNPLVYTIESGDVEIGEIVHLGHEFLGWYDNPEFSGEKVTVISGGSIGDKHVYAKFEKLSYVVSFDTMGGNTIDSIILEYNAAFENLPIPTKDGYEFKGWYLDDGYYMPANDCRMPAIEITLYAKWECDHIIAADKSVAPTCTETGLTEGSHCDKCNKVFVAQTIVDALGHKPVIDEPHPPTCSVTGLTEGSHCDVCGEVLVPQEIVGALGHVEIVDEGKEPTCTQTGLTEGSHCDVCGEVLVEQNVIYAPGHTPIVDAGVLATCIKTGLTEGSHCNVCGEVLIPQEIVDALGHVEIVDERKEPTCTQTGLTEDSHCDVCGEVLVAQTIVDALGHKPVVDEPHPPTCSVTGLTEGSHCNVCGEVLVPQEIVGALGHVEIVDEGKEPTCTQTGLTEGSHCDVCGEIVKKQVLIGATGHKWVLIPEVEATCTTNGSTEGVKCSVCDTIYIATKVVPATGHSWDDDYDTTCNNACGETRKPLYTLYNGADYREENGNPYAVLVKAADLQMTSCVVHEDTVSIEAGAFRKCSSLQTLVIPFVGDRLINPFVTHFGYLFGAETYEDNATCVPQSLKYVVVLGGTRLESYAFNGCASLEEIRLPSSIEYMGQGALAGCDALKTLYVPFVGETIAAGDDIALNATATNISSRSNHTLAWLFAKTQADTGVLGCKFPESLTELHIARGTKLASYALMPNISEIASLQYVFLPNTLKEVGVRALNAKYIVVENVADLFSLTFGGEQIYDYVISTDECEQIKAGAIPSRALTIPEGPTSIPSYALAGAEYTKVVVAASVIEIEENAFDSCDKLRWLEFSDNSNLTTICANSFNGCTNLAYIELPEMLTTLDTSFIGCNNILEVANESSLTITASAMVFPGTSSSSNIKISCDRVYNPEQEQTNFTLTDEGFLIYEDTTLVAYMGGQEEVEIPSNVTLINANAFYGMTEVKLVKMDGEWSNSTSSSLITSPIVDTTDPSVNAQNLLVDKLDEEWIKQ